jgi:preprotein translocase subunit SecD
MTGRRATLTSVLVLTVVLGGACGGEGGARRGQAADARRSTVFALRPVRATPDPPCPRTSDGDPVYPGVNPGTAPACFALGDPIVDDGDVRTASYAYDLSSGPTVSLVLGRTGSANLDDYAAGHQGQRLAIVVNDRVVSAPAIQSPSFLGRIVISHLPQEEAEQLFNRFQKPTG